MKKGPGYTLVVLGTMAFVTASHAQGMTDQPADWPPVSGPQDENRTDSDVPDLGAPSGTAEPGPSDTGDVDLPTAPGDDVSDLKGLPPAEGLPEAHGPDDTSPGSPASGAQAPPSSGY